jgi:hypothetical protein
MLHLGDVIYVLEIAERGVAVMFRADALWNLNDVNIQIDDAIRIVATDGSQFDTVVSGFEAQPTLTLLFPATSDTRSIGRGDQVFLLRYAPPR